MRTCIGDQALLRRFPLATVDPQLASVSGVGWEALGSILAHDTAASLEELSLPHNYVDVGAATALAAGLRTNSGLVRLSLASQYAFHDEAIAPLADALDRNLGSGLRVLDLSSNAIGAAGVKYGFDWLRGEEGGGGSAWVNLVW